MNENFKESSCFNLDTNCMLTEADVLTSTLFLFLTLSVPIPLLHHCSHLPSQVHHYHCHLFRYAILAPKAIPAGFMDGRKACELLLESMALEANEYRLGHSKVFFRAGVLGRLEDMRDQKLGQVLTQLQAFARGYIMRKDYRKLLDQRYEMRFQNGHFYTKTVSLSLSGLMCT